MATADITIRTATIHDLPAIVSIYNQAVAAKFATADTIPWQVDDKQQWFHKHTPHEYPIYVAISDGHVTGWLSVSAYRPGRLALRFTKEVSYYIGGDYQRRGIGSILLQHAIDNASALNVRNYIAILLDVNKGSIKLLEKHGFMQWGHLPAVADFDGLICGHLYYGLPVAK